MYYPISQDGQVQAYQQLRKKILAEEAARKNKQKMLRIELGLPEGEQKVVSLVRCNYLLVAREKRSSFERAPEEE